MSRVIPRTRAPLVPTPGAVDDFTRDVAASLDAGVLRHSAREALLLQARDIGLEPFEASLLIARVQRRCAGATPAGDITGSIDDARGRRGASLGWWVAGILLLEGIAIGALTRLI